MSANYENVLKALESTGNPRMIRLATDLRGSTSSPTPKRMNVEIDNVFEVFRLVPDEQISDEQLGQWDKQIRDALKMDMGKITAYFDIVINNMTKNDRDHPAKWPVTVKALKAAKKEFRSGGLSPDDAVGLLNQYKPYTYGEKRVDPATTMTCQALSAYVQACRDPKLLNRLSEQEQARFKECANKVETLSEGLSNGAFSVKN